MEMLCLDIERQVYCLAGLPFDAVDMQQAKGLLRGAVRDRTPFFFSTPNLNFLIACQKDATFRDSVIHSDLNVADGMPLVWMARLLGIPVRERVAGSSLFEAMDVGDDLDAYKIKVYFFGGPDGVAEAACNALNARKSGLVCVGFQSPGFVSVAEMSEQHRIEAINASGADFVVVALGARKGQEWIERNRATINAPLISHLGAVVNFVAGSISRAPAWMQRTGLEWLWRIREEPSLWKRYCLDGLGFIRLLFGQVLPYAIWLRIKRTRLENAGRDCKVTLSSEADFSRVMISGVIADTYLQPLRDVLKAASGSRQTILIDLTGAEYLGPGAFGLLLVLKKHQDALGMEMKLINVSTQLLRFFRWNGAEFIL